MKLTVPDVCKKTICIPAVGETIQLVPGGPIFMRVCDIYGQAINEGFNPQYEYLVVNLTNGEMISIPRSHEGGRKVEPEGGKIRFVYVD